MIEAKGNYNSKNILNEKGLVEKASFLKKKNRKIGLCVGSFDLLHPGHVNHLVSAKKYCDVLFVGITSDRFVAKRKKGRPVFNEQMRAFFISQIKPVDYAFISDYLTANEAISLVKPDFYIKGPDYTNKKDEEIDSERDSVKRVGGKIVYTSDEKLSATDIIRHIQKLEF